MSVHLQKELEAIKMKLLHLGAMAETSIEKAGYAVKNLDRSVAKEIIGSDHLADMKEVEIEEDCLKTLALHTPVANDLRFIVATLKINNDLERVCDLAVNIARRVKHIAKQDPITQEMDFSEMSGRVLKMLNNSIDSFITQDVDLAFQTCEMDDEVDQLNREFYQKVQSGIKANPERCETFIDYLSISRALERVADYSTNIAEDVIYMVQGKIIRHQPENSSDTGAQRPLEV